jgi:hypothetical protein
MKAEACLGVIAGENIIVRARNQTPVFQPIGSYYTKTYLGGGGRRKEEALASRTHVTTIPCRNKQLKKTEHKQEHHVKIKIQVKLSLCLIKQLSTTA